MLCKAEILKGDKALGGEASVHLSAHSPMLGFPPSQDPSTNL